MSEPTTEASKALLRRPSRAWPKGHEEWAETLAIIEAEAYAKGFADMKSACHDEKNEARAEALDLDALTNAVEAGLLVGPEDAAESAAAIAREYRADMWVPPTPADLDLLLIQWWPLQRDEYVAYIAARADALDVEALARALDDPERFGWSGPPAYAIAYAAALRDVKAFLAERQR